MFITRLLLLLSALLLASAKRPISLSVSCRGVYGPYDGQKQSPQIAVKLTSKGRNSGLKLNTLLFHYSDILNYKGIPTKDEILQNVSVDVCKDCEDEPWSIEEIHTPQDLVVNTVLSDAVVYKVENVGMYCAYFAVEGEGHPVRDMYTIDFEQPYGSLAPQQKLVLDYLRTWDLPIIVTLQIAYLLRLVYIKRHSKGISSLGSVDPNIEANFAGPLRSTQGGVNLVQTALKFLISLTLATRICGYFTLKLMNISNSAFAPTVVSLFSSCLSGIELLLLFLLASGWGTLYKDRKLNDFPEGSLKIGGSLIAIVTAIDIINTTTDVNAVIKNDDPHGTGALKLLSTILVIILFVVFMRKLRATNKEISQYLDKGLAKRFTRSYRVVIFTPLVMTLMGFTYLMHHLYQDVSGNGDPAEIAVQLFETSWRDNAIMNLVKFVFLSAPLTYVILAIMWDRVNPDEYDGSNVAPQDIPTSGRVVLQE